jgi:hypothetical protein
MHGEVQALGRCRTAVIPENEVQDIDLKSRMQQVSSCTRVDLMVIVSRYKSFCPLIFGVLTSESSVDAWDPKCESTPIPASTAAKFGDLDLKSHLLSTL